jgi:hypothetical protein
MLYDRYQKKWMRSTRMPVMQMQHVAHPKVDRAALQAIAGCLVDLQETTTVISMTALKDISADSTIFGCVLPHVLYLPASFLLTLYPN